MNFNGNDISWIGVYDEKGNGIVKKDYANKRTDLFHYEYDANGNILYSEHGVINDGAEKIIVEIDLDKIDIPNDGTEVIVEKGARYEYDAQGRVTRICGDFSELKSSYYNLSSEVGRSWRFGFGKKEYADEQGFEISYNEQGKISKIKWNYICAEAPKNADYEKPDKDGYMESFKWNPSNPKECYFAMSYRDDGTLDEYVYEGWEYTEDKLGQYWEYRPADSQDPIKSKVDSVEFIMKAKGYEHRNFAISNKGLDEWNTRSDSAFELKRWELACVDSASYSSGEKAYADAFLSDDSAEEKPRLHTWGMNNNLLELVMDVSNLGDDFTIYEVYRFTYNDWKEVKKITQNSFLIYHLPEGTQESGWIHEEHDSILSPEFQYLLRY